LANIGFIGCHEISWHCLKKICELSQKFNDSISIVMNYTPEKSGKYSAYTDFDTLKKQYNFPLFYVSDVSGEKELQLLKNAKLDVLFIIGWHRIVSSLVLTKAKINLGIHSSLLPKNRGSSPINWQLIKGDKIGGITLFHLTPDVDAGAIVDKEEFKISENDDVRSVYDKAIISSIHVLEKNWKEIHKLKPKSVTQKESEISINDLRKPSDGIINWENSTKKCYNWIRALTHPYPGSFTFWNGKKIFIWKSRISDLKNSKPGEILECKNKIIISTGDGSLEIISLQIENEPICSNTVFLYSYNLQKGDIFSK
jgi:methionyl-tRNA formyltransferase